MQSHDIINNIPDIRDDDNVSNSVAESVKDPLTEYSKIAIKSNEENIYDTVSYDSDALFEQWKNQGSLISKQAKVIRRACRNQNYYFIPRIFILLVIGAAAAATCHLLCKKYGVLSKFPLINVGFAFFAATFVSCVMFGVVENIRHKYFEKDKVKLERLGGNYFSSRNILVLTTGLSFAFLYHFLSEAGKMPLFSQNPLVNLGFAFILTSLTFYFIFSMAGNIANHLYSKEADNLYSKQENIVLLEQSFNAEFVILESLEKYRKNCENDGELVESIFRLGEDGYDLKLMYDQFKDYVGREDNVDISIQHKESMFTKVKSDLFQKYCDNHWYDFYSRQNIPSKVEDVELAFSNPLTMITTPVLYCIDKCSSKGNDQFGYTAL